MVPASRQPLARDGRSEPRSDPPAASGARRPRAMSGRAPQSWSSPATRAPDHHHERRDDDGSTAAGHRYSVADLPETGSAYRRLPGRRAATVRVHPYGGRDATATADGAFDAPNSLHRTRCVPARRARRQRLEPRRPQRRERPSQGEQQGRRPRHVQGEGHPAPRHLLGRRRRHAGVLPLRPLRRRRVEEDQELEDPEERLRAVHRSALRPSSPPVRSGTAATGPSRTGSGSRRTTAARPATGSCTSPTGAAPHRC